MYQPHDSFLGNNSVRTRLHIELLIAQSFACSPSPRGSPPGLARAHVLHPRLLERRGLLGCRGLGIECLAGDAAARGAEQSDVRTSERLG